MSYQTDEEIESIINNFKYIEINKKEKIETVNGAINKNNSITSYRILKKIY